MRQRLIVFQSSFLEIHNQEASLAYVMIFLLGSDFNLVLFYDLDDEVRSSGVSWPQVNVKEASWVLVNV